MRRTFQLCWGLVLAAWLFLALWPRPVPAYIGGPPLSLGLMCSWSTHVIGVKVERVDKEKNLIVFRKLIDYKGKWPADSIKHVVPAGLVERQQIFQWADVGRTTVMCALESYRWSHTYIDSVWYASNTADWQWWNVSHGEPLLLRMFSGKSERLPGVCSAILGGKEVIVPCLADGSPEDLRQRKTKVQRLKASIKLLDYNARRDFVGYGGDDFNRIHGMPGFTHSAALGRVDPEATSVSCVDFDGDGRLDLCLTGAGRVLLLQNAGDYWNEVPLPPISGCRGALWADYNGDGKPDLLLITANGPRLFTNVGHGFFRDDSHRLPKEPYWNLTAGAWIDYDMDGRPDILLANGFHGLRMWRNRGVVDPPPPPYGAPAPTPPTEPLFEDVSEQVGLGPDGVGGNVKGDTLTVCDVNGDGRPDFLYGAGTGMLILNTPKGFVEAKNSGIVYKPGKVGPVFGDFDNSGVPGLFVPQLDGRCKLFKNDGKGHFTDVTSTAGDLAKPMGMATCAAWGDVDNDGHLDLVVGCLKGPNRFFRNLGNGRFEDATESIGLQHTIYNTQGIALIDLNNDGQLDMVFANEGQDSVVLLGNPEFSRRRTPVALHVGGHLGIVGSNVRVFDKAGKAVGSNFIGGGEGRGSQQPPILRLALDPGSYRVQARFSSGHVQTKDIVVGAAPLRVLIDDAMGKAE
jgi:hypothetical protein